MQADSIQTVRRFNRTISRRIGALENSYLARGRPLAEARVIYEIGPKGEDIQAIRNRLGLDSGYLSRLLRSLEAQKLVAVAASQDDRRRRIARLTATGLAEFSAYETLSDTLAADMIDPLDPPRRERLLTAMAEVEQLIRVASITLEPIAPDSTDARFCLNAYFQELANRFETGFDPAHSNPAPDDSLVPPSGSFVIARLDTAPVGCGALKRLSGDTGEIKRMWTAPEARSLGIARRILRRLEAIAMELGLRTLRLETNRSLVEAQALYRSEGFREVPAFNQEPYAHHWFQKDLSV
jgi:DNA-binding MarR family transcriptional regulator/GNAT superfamily N-acetyltransferase